MRLKKNILKLYIHGDIFVLKRTIRGKAGDQVAAQVVRSKRLSRKAIRLWFLIHDCKFDQDIWDDLDYEEKKFIYILVEELNIPKSIEYKLASLDLTKDLFDRLELIEGNIKAGNVNPDLIKEAEDVLSGIVELQEMSLQKKNRYIEKLKNTYEYILKTQEETS